MTNTDKKNTTNFINTLQQKTIKKIVKNFNHFKNAKKSSRSTFLKFTAVVMIWRGIRDLLDIRILPNYRRISCIICIIIWLLILICYNWKIDELEKF